MIYRPTIIFAQDMAQKKNKIDMLRGMIIPASFGLLVGVLLIYYLTIRPYRLKYKEMKFEKKYSIEINKMILLKGYLYVNDSLQIRPLKLKTDSGYIWLDELMVVGDSLSKQENTFSVLIIRDKNTYVFSPSGQ